MKTQTLLLQAVLWLARISAVLMFVFWGGFFLEHLIQWFLRQDGLVPPPYVWLGQLFHLAMLIGLGLIVLWPGWGAAVTVASTILFFCSIGYNGFPYIALLNLSPVVLATVYTIMLRTQKSD